MGNTMGNSGGQGAETLIPPNPGGFIWGSFPAPIHSTNVGWYDKRLILHGIRRFHFYQRPTTFTQIRTFARLRFSVARMGNSVLKETAIKNAKAKDKP